MLISSHLSIIIASSSHLNIKDTDQTSQLCRRICIFALLKQYGQKRYVRFRFPDISYFFSDPKGFYSYLKMKFYYTQPTLLAAICYWFCHFRCHIFHQYLSTLPRQWLEMINTSDKTAKGT